MREYALSDVMRLAGLKRSQVEYLVRAGVIAPSSKASGGTGEHRKFNFVDVFEFATAAALMAVGVDVPTVRQFFNSTLRGDAGRGFGAFLTQPDWDYLVVINKPATLSGGVVDLGIGRESCQFMPSNGVMGMLSHGFWCRVVNLRLLLLELEGITGEHLKEALLSRWKQSAPEELTEKYRAQQEKVEREIEERRQKRTEGEE